MDDYQLQQRQITNLLNKYRKNRDKEIYRKVMHELDMYMLTLDQNYAPSEKYDWHNQQKKVVNQLKQQKQIKNTKEIINGPANNSNNNAKQEPTGQNLGLEYTKALGEEIGQALNRGEKAIQKAIDISSYIRIELDRQIQQLDHLYQQNKDMDNRLERVKKGLIIIIRRAMLNKLTRCLAILLVLAIIALIVIYILRGGGIV